MLQEESCKKLAALISKSYIQAQMKEFASRIDIDLTKQIRQDHKDINVQDRLTGHIRDASPRPGRYVPGHMFENKEENEFYDEDGQGESYMGGS